MIIILKVSNGREWKDYNWQGIMDKLNIVIVNTQAIPSSSNGAASVNRILSYAIGLMRRGNSVHIVSTAPGRDTRWGTYEGISVKHVGRSCNSSIFKFLSYFLSSFYLINELNKLEKDVVLFVTSNYFLIILLELYCKFHKIKIVNERSEYPFVLINKKLLNRLLAPLYIHTAYKLLDGMILMTKPLMDFYHGLAKKNCKFLEVPMTVDVSRFNNCMEVRTPIDGDYIAYCGNMGGNKDGLANLIEAFSIVEKRGYPISLVLIGGANSQEEFDALVKLNKALGNQHIVFYGKAMREEIPSLLKNAKILALARPSGLQSTGGFPTKLGEYLSTGKPVVVTAVGDIPLYLHNNVNAYVVQPDNISTFADALCKVLDNYDDALSVGKEGRKLVETIFNGDYQAQRIEDFLRDFI